MDPKYFFLPHERCIYLAFKQLKKRKNVPLQFVKRFYLEPFLNWKPSAVHINFFLPVEKKKNIIVLYIYVIEFSF